MGFDLLYLLALGALGPVLLWRILARGKYRRNFRARLGARGGSPEAPGPARLPPKAPGRPRVWVHAVSVGEVVAAEPLVRALEAGGGGPPGSAPEVVVSTITETGQAVAAKRFGRERVFYTPFDLSACVARAWRSVRPELLVLMELELWPNLIARASRAGVPVLVANGRISERSFRRFRRFRRLLGATFARVARWAVQTPEYAERLRALGVEPSRIEVAGNLKHDALPVEGPPPEAARLRREARAALGIAESPEDALVLFGGSTHPTEEAALLKVFLREREKRPGLRLVLAPRHPERLEEVAREIAQAGLPVRRKTEIAGGAPGGSSAGPPPVVLLDTMGELAALYRAADVVFVGGSLVPHGGQNLMEPAALSRAVACGPHVHNFRAEAEALLQAGGLRLVADERELAEALGRLLDDASERERMGRAARAAVEARRGASARTAAIARELLAKGAERTRPKDEG